MSDGAHSSISSFDNADHRNSTVPSPSYVGAASPAASSSHNSDHQGSASRDARIARFYNLGEFVCYLLVFFITHIRHNDLLNLVW